MTRGSLSMGASFSETAPDQVKPPRGKPRGLLKRMAELSIADSPPSLKLRRALLAIFVTPKPLDRRHLGVGGWRGLIIPTASPPRIMAGKPWGMLAKESKNRH